MVVGCCNNANGVYMLPLPQIEIYRETNKETLTEAIYKVINI